MYACRSRHEIYGRKSTDTAQNYCLGRNSDLLVYDQPLRRCVMSDAVIVGIITAVAAVVCQVIISMSGRSAAQRERAESNRLIVYRLEQLETKVDKHNNVIERVYELEKSSNVTQEQIKAINHRISDLEEAAK